MEGVRFSCTLCGDCCTGNQVVRLTGGDLDLLVRRLGLRSRAELRTRGLVSLVHETVGRQLAWRPRLRFKTKPYHQCPFLANSIDEAGVYRGLCSLHPDAKPLVCRLAPLTREVEDWGDRYEETWSAVEPVAGCPGMGLGDLLPVLAPAELAAPLAEEVAWMRYLLRQSPFCPDEDAAWDMLVRWKAA